MVQAYGGGMMIYGIFMGSSFLYKSFITKAGVSHKTYPFPQKVSCEMYYLFH